MQKPGKLASSVHRSLRVCGVCDMYSESLLTVCLMCRAHSELGLFIDPEWAGIGEFPLYGFPDNHEEFVKANKLLLQVRPGDGRWSLCLGQSQEGCQSCFLLSSAHSNHV